MANRPVFLATNDKGRFFKEVNIEFDWFAGMATSQKQKSVKSLHKAAESEGIFDILEVSTKSEEVLGNKLSAFNISLKNNEGKEILLEVAFQGSKVFDNGGPYHDLYKKDPLEVKKDELTSFSSRKKLQWLEDPMNQDLRFTRNRIRKAIIPELEKKNLDGVSWCCPSADLSIGIHDSIDNYYPQGASKNILNADLYNTFFG